MQQNIKNILYIKLQTPWKARTPAPTLERFEAVYGLPDWDGDLRLTYTQNLPLKHKNYRKIYDNRKSNVSILLTIPSPYYVDGLQNYATFLQVFLKKIKKNGHLFELF